MGKHVPGKACMSVSVSECLSVQELRVGGWDSSGGEASAHHCVLLGWMLLSTWDWRVHNLELFSESSLEEAVTQHPWPHHCNPTLPTLPPLPGTPSPLTSQAPLPPQHITPPLPCMPPWPPTLNLVVDLHASQSMQPYLPEIRVFVWEGTVASCSQGCY